jgi:hypothetical protein
MHGADVLVQAEGLAPRVGPLLHRLVLPFHLHLNVLNQIGDVKFRDVTSKTLPIVYRLLGFGKTNQARFSNLPL